MRLEKEGIEDNTKNESLKGGGGRLKYNNLDGDMPLCLRTERKSKGGSSSNESEKDNSRNMMSGSKDLCVVTAKKEKQRKSYKQRCYIHRATEEYEINALKLTN